MNRCVSVLFCGLIVGLSGCAVFDFFDSATSTLKKVEPTIERLPSLIDTVEKQIGQLGETATGLMQSTETVVGQQSEGLTRIAINAEAALAELTIAARETSETLRVIREQTNAIGDKTVWMIASIVGTMGWFVKFSITEKVKLTWKKHRNKRRIKRRSKRR